MASVLILTRNSEGWPLANRLAFEGHIVKVHQRDGMTTHNKKGANPSLVSNPTRLLEQFDLVVGSSSGVGDLVDECREKGKLVVGGGMFDEKLQLDPDYLVRVIDVVYPGLHPVESKIKLMLSGWFNGNTFVRPYSIAINKHRFMEGDKGPLTDGMGSITWLSNNNKLVEKVFNPLVELLTRLEYVGPLTVNCDLNESEMCVVGIRATFNYNTFSAYLELIRIGCFDFMYGVATKRFEQVQGLNGDIALSVKLSLPPWPYVWEPHKIPDCSIPREARKHVWEQHGDCVIGYVTARGNTIREVKRRVYRTVENIAIHPTIQFRRDIGDDYDEVFGLLKEWGWLDG